MDGTILIAILTPVLGIIGVAIGAVVKGFMTLKLERQKFEWSMILNALNAEETTAAAGKLKFLVDAGLIRDDQGRIAELTKIPEKIPLFESAARLSHRWVSRLGVDIREVQSRLKKLGFYEGPITGRFGSKTTEAIRGYQKSVGLVADGILGPNTVEQLLDKTADEEAAPPIINLRGGPGVDYPKAGMIQKGATIRVLQESDDWCEISTRGGTKGWIRRELTKFMKEAPEFQ